MKFLKHNRVSQIQCTYKSVGYKCTYKYSVHTNSDSDNGCGSKAGTHQTDLRNVESKGYANGLDVRRNKEVAIKDTSRLLV